VNEGWVLGQQNLIGFVMVDATGTEVPGLAGLLSGNISKNGVAANAMVGVFAEIAGMTGHYTYLSTAAEANTAGIVNIEISGPGAVQQNLEYPVEDRNVLATERTYTVTNSVTLLPIEGVTIWISLDVAGTQVIWSGVTDVAGVARTVGGSLPRLDPGTYYFWKQYTGFSDDDNPDMEVFA